MNPTRTIRVRAGRSRHTRPCLLALLAIAVLGTGCWAKGPLHVRFGREVDEEKLARLPRLGGTVVLLVDVEFWTDQQRVSRIPIARRDKSFIIGPGAAEMTGRMFERMFDDVVTARFLDRVPDPERFDYVIRLVHDDFDDRSLFLPLFTNQRYRVGIGAEVSRMDDTELGRVSGEGSDNFWIASIFPLNPLESDRPLLAKASRTLNAAVQESLFELMDELAELPAFTRETARRFP